MTKEELQLLLASGNAEKIVKAVQAFEKKIKVGDKTLTIKDLIKQYDPAQHPIMSPTEYEDKTIYVPTGETYTDAITGETKERTEPETVKVARLPLPIQKKIVRIAAAFVVGEKIIIESKAMSKGEKDFVSLIIKIWEDTKLDYKSMKLAELQMSETQCAEIWYDEVDETYWRGTVNEKSIRKPGMIILSESEGYKLYPIKDEFKRMIGFAREYTVTREGKEVTLISVITDDKFIDITKTDSGYTKLERPNTLGFIPVVYYEQPLPEYQDVQPLINRKETKVSRLADTNDYFAAPAMVSEGDVENLPAKGEVGKLFQINGGGSLKYLTYDSAPENSKLEFDIVDKEIHSGTHTPAIDFDSMKGVVADLSGYAIRLLFMDPQMKAKYNQQSFGEFIQRRLNILKKMIIAYNPTLFESMAGLSISPKFKDFMPVNETEYNKLLWEAHENGMISQKTMIERSTLVKDPIEEENQIKSEKDVNPQPPIVPVT